MRGLRRTASACARAFLRRIYIKNSVSAGCGELRRARRRRHVPGTIWLGKKCVRTNYAWNLKAKPCVSQIFAKMRTCACNLGLTLFCAHKMRMRWT